MSHDDLPLQTRMVNGDGTYYILRSADDRRW
jgi:hypothetical protein